MNRDDIIRMAREAGIPIDAQHPGWLLPHLERFANLVAAAERERCIDIVSSVEFTSLDHMPHEAATIIRERGEE